MINTSYPSSSSSLYFSGTGSKVSDAGRSIKKGVLGYSSKMRKKSIDNLFQRSLGLENSWVRSVTPDRTLNVDKTKSNFLKDSSEGERKLELDPRRRSMENITLENRWLEPAQRKQKALIERTEYKTPDEALQIALDNNARGSYSGTPHASIIDPENPKRVVQIRTSDSAMQEEIIAAARRKGIRGVPPFRERSIERPVSIQHQFLGPGASGLRNPEPLQTQTSGIHVLTDYELYARQHNIPLAGEQRIPLPQQNTTPSPSALYPTRVQQRSRRTSNSSSKVSAQADLPADYRKYVPSTPSDSGASQ
jgi:hypothetical protein